jgi:hypothetical protein
VIVHHLQRKGKNHDNNLYSFHSHYRRRRAVAHQQVHSHGRENQDYLECCGGRPGDTVAVERVWSY